MSSRAERLARCERAAEAKRGPWAALRPFIDPGLADKLEGGGLEALTRDELAELETLLAGWTHTEAEKP